MVILKVALGLSLLVVAWAYLFKKDLIFKLNAWMRESIFSDQVALFSGRRVAILLMVLGALSLFSGLNTFVRPTALPPAIADQILAQAREDLAQKRYPNALRRCRELVKRNPDSIAAWETLIETHSRMGEKDKARQAAFLLLRLDPNNRVAKTISRPE